MVLGDNVAAQLHAESALENCFSSHWGIDGLKPYMRYTLAGGYQSNAENASGLSYCIKASDGYIRNAGARLEIREAMEGLMSSPGHRDNILDRHHKRINIGLAWDSYNFKVIQHFEGDYVEYQQPPRIEGGMLSMSGTVRNGVSFGNDDDLGVQIFYDPPPQTLSTGQISRTYCYDQGLEIGSVRPPLKEDWFYTEDAYNVNFRPCPDPYAVPAAAAAPGSADEAHAAWQAAYDESQMALWRFGTVQWITAIDWIASGEVFHMTADIRSLLANYGKGVYTVTVWGSIDGDILIISQYSIFHGVVPPDSYGIYTAVTDEKKAAQSVSSAPSPTYTPTPTPTPTPTARPVQVDPNRPNLRHLDLKRYVLSLINDLRASTGKVPLDLGDNVAAQLHAESMLTNCFASHWGMDGLKPHIRYALAGGHELTREDVSGLSYCHTDSGSLPPYDDLRAEIEHSLGNWIGSRENWANIRRESHRTVNIGLAWNKYQVFLVLQFEESYVRRLDTARIDGQYLTLAASVRNGVVFGNDRDLAIEIVYDPPSRALNRGQLSRTSCYESGRRIAALRATPLGGEGHYLESYTLMIKSCPDPYRVPADSSPPGSARDARDFQKAAVDSETVSTYTIPFYNAADWLVDRDSFSIRAQIDEFLATWGPGIYTVLVYGPVDGTPTLILEYPIFYRVDRPTTYDRW